MRRNPSAAAGRSDTPTELIARVSAEHGSPDGAAPELRPVDTVAPDRPRARSLTGRLVPLAVGAAVMLVASTIATVARPADDDPLIGFLNSALGQPDPTRARKLAPSDLAANTTPDVASSDPPQAPGPSTSAAEQNPAVPPPISPSDGDGVQAAATRGWIQTDGDEFNAAKSSKWEAYEGAGYGGIGRRTADAITVENGALVIRGDGQGNTGGMAWTDDQRFGRWEMRARFPQGDGQYHPTLILWPEGEWPTGGEIDFAETTSASTDVSFFLHYSSTNQQKRATKAVDITQWHNYAVEWVDGRVTGYLDGEPWFESTAADTLPPGSMHATIQLDYFPAGGSPQPSEMHVDYLRIYG